MPGTGPIGVIAGAALAELVARGARRLPAEYHVLFYAAGLTSAAAIYPAARRRWRLDRQSAGELVGLLGYGGASLLAAKRPRPRANRLLAAGWASDALFDAAHGDDDSSRLPRWYPALCAGYDLVVCAHLARAACAPTRRLGGCRQQRAAAATALLVGGAPRAPADARKPPRCFLRQAALREGRRRGAHRSAGTRAKRNSPARRSSGPVDSAARRPLRERCSR